jgi:type I restriction-modification system DNA methylase subunit
MRTIERKNKLGEVFTPLQLVNEMLDKLPQEEITNPDKIIGDISGCGNGNFLVEILNRRLKAGIKHIDAIKTIFGVDIMEDNIQECKERLTQGSKDENIWKILNHNIICADALDERHPGWTKVGYMWAYHIGWEIDNNGRLIHHEKRPYVEKFFQI